MSSIERVLIPCRSDNYAVLLHLRETGETLLIDAPEAEPIQAVLQTRHWRLSDIFITHHHHDHTAGCDRLIAVHGCPVTGPREEASRIGCLSRRVGDGDKLVFGGLTVQVLGTAGHTTGHISYYFPEISVAFTGDALFALGCGRLFEGDPQTMFASLQTLACLPDNTEIYCGHEYTLANARFALSIEPENQLLTARVKEIEALRAAGKPTLPTTIGAEKATNPFLRTRSPSIRARLGLVDAPDWQVFARLRQLKDCS